MGSDDLELQFGLDSRVEDMSDYTLVGSTPTYDDSHGIRWQNDLEGVYYKPILKNTATSFLVKLYAYHHTSNGNANQSEFKTFVKLSDGNYYVVGHRGSNTGGIGVNGSYLGFVKQSTRPTHNGAVELDVSTPGFYIEHSDEDKFRAYGLYFKSNGKVDLYDWDLEVGGGFLGFHDFATIQALEIGDGTLVAADIMTWSGAKLEEYGFGQSVIQTLNDKDGGLACLIIEADLPSPDGGSAILPNINSFTTSTNIGGGAGANFIVNYDRNNNATTTIDTSGNTITFAASGDTITRASGSWIADGFKVGDLIEVRGSVSNDAIGDTYIIASVIPSEINLTSAAGLTDETLSTGNLEVDLYPSLKTYKENLGKSITIQDTTYGNYMFKGEIKSMRIDTEKITYRVEEGIRKLTKQFANTNPVYYLSEILRTVDARIHDEFAEWDDTGLGEHAGRLVTTKDNDLYETTIFPTVVTPYSADSTEPTGWTQQAPDDEGGSVDYLYFDNRLVLQNESWVYKDGNHTNDVYGIRFTDEATPGMEFLFKLWYKDGTAFNKLTLKSIIRFTSLKGTKVDGVTNAHFPKIWLEHNTLGWVVELNNWNDEDYSTANKESDEEWDIEALRTGNTFAGKSPIFTDEIVVTDLFAYSINNYFQNTSAVNANGFRSSEIKVRLKGADVPNTTLFDPKMEVHYMHLQFEDTGTSQTSQAQELSVGLIYQNTDSSLIMNESVAWDLDDFPPADGVTTGDDYYISDNVETALTNVFANANTNFTLTTDFGNSYAQYGETEDLRYTPIFDYVQKLSSEFNWAFWYEPTSTTDVIKIADQLTSTGITLTTADIVNYYDNAFSVNVDINNIRTKIVVIGDNGVTAVKTGSGGTPDYNVDVNFTLGDEETAYTDNELYSQNNVDAYVTSKQNVNKSKSVSMELALDYDSPAQDYSTIGIGKTVLVEIPEYSSAVDGALFIEGITYVNTEDIGWQQFVTLHLMKRVV